VYRYAQGSGSAISCPKSWAENSDFPIYAKIWGPKIPELLDNTVMCDPAGIPSWMKLFENPMHRGAYVCDTLIDYLDHPDNQINQDLRNFNIDDIFVPLVSDNLYTHMVFRKCSTERYNETITNFIKRITELLNLRLVHEGAPYTIKSVRKYITSAREASGAYCCELDYSIYVGGDAELALI